MQIFMDKLLFGEKIRVFAKQKFGSLTALAANLEIDLPSLVRYTKGGAKPGVEFFAKMLTLGCDLNWLLDEQVRLNTVSEPSPAYNATNKLQQEVADLRATLQQIQQLIKNNIGEDHGE